MRFDILNREQIDRRERSPRVGGTVRLRCLAQAVSNLNRTYPARQHPLPTVFTRPHTSP